jgi:hypothetical protein
MVGGRAETHRSLVCPVSSSLCAETLKERSVWPLRCPERCDRHHMLHALCLQWGMKESERLVWEGTALAF